MLGFYCVFLINTDLPVCQTVSASALDSAVSLNRVTRSRDVC